MLRFSTFLILATPLFAAPVPKAEAVKPERFTGRRIQLLRDSRVQRELVLSAEQRIAVIDHFETAHETLRAKERELYPPFSQADPLCPDCVSEKSRELAQFTAKQLATTQKSLAAILTKPQLARLMELERRYLGPFAFLDADMVTELKLTLAQSNTVAQAFHDYLKRHDEELVREGVLGDRTVGETIKPTMVAILKTLTREQVDRWKEMLGNAPKIDPHQHPAAQVFLEDVASAFRRSQEKE